MSNRSLLLRSLRHPLPNREVTITRNAVGFIGEKSLSDESVRPGDLNCEHKPRHEPNNPVLYSCLALLALAEQRSCR